MIDIALRQDVAQELLPTLPVVGMGAAHLGIVGVDECLKARLGIPHAQQPHVGQLSGTRVIHLQRNDIMLLVGNHHSPRESLLRCSILLSVAIADVEVAQEEHRRASFHHLRHILHRLRHIRSLALGLELQYLVDDVKDVLASFLRRDIFLNTVREEDDTYLVVVLYGRERQRSSNLSHEGALRLSCSTEVERPRHIDKEHHRELALFLKHFYVGMMEARRHIPVDVAHIVAKLILAHLSKGHTTPLEGRMVLSCKDILTQAARLDLNLPNLAENLRCQWTIEKL